MKVRSDWLTSARVKRLRQILLGVSYLREGISQREAELLLWRQCGGPLSEIPSLLQLLVDLQLLRIDATAIKRTRGGDQIARGLRSSSHNALAPWLIRGGYFHEQARILLELGKIDASGNLRCESHLGRAGAPQLLGILEDWEGVRLFPEIFIPKEILAEIDTVWALLPRTGEVPRWAAERKAVGDRAEMYSFQYERTRIGASSVRWVSRDSDSLGWDIEDISTTPRRCIEVKGRRDSEVVFYLSENEWTKAREVGTCYEIQFWGEIDLSVDPATEYSILRANGYPIVIKNPIERIAAQEWRATPIQWKITR